VTIPVLECQATTPTHVARNLHRALVLLLCPHPDEGWARGGCPTCTKLLTPLVRPLAHALFTAASGEEHVKAFDGGDRYHDLSLAQYEAIGHAIDGIEQAAGMPV
jgi:hypothetical protein